LCLRDVISKDCHVGNWAFPGLRLTSHAVRQGLKAIWDTRKEIGSHEDSRSAKRLTIIPRRSNQAKSGKAKWLIRGRKIVYTAAVNILTSHAIFDRSSQTAAASR
jgi:hypothetical protein